MKYKEYKGYKWSSEFLIKSNLHGGLKIHLYNSSKGKFGVINYGLECQNLISYRSIYDILLKNVISSLPEELSNEPLVIITLNSDYVSKLLIWLSL